MADILRKKNSKVSIKLKFRILEIASKVFLLFVFFGVSATTN